MLKLVYATDLHGSAARYHALLDTAVAEGAQAIVNGGDMFPAYGTDMLRAQREFLHGTWRDHLLQTARAGIHWLGIPGNDDLAALDADIRSVVMESPYLHDLTRAPVRIGEYEFVGMNLVADYPFRLKDRCRLDSPGFHIPPQLGSALLSRPDGLRTVDNWEQLAASLPTLEDELLQLPLPPDAGRAVCVIHMPPSDAGLDVCYDGRRVGSSAVRRFILERQPAMTLHGHIHESPAVSGKWRNWIGNTVCIQPGQEDDRLVCCVIHADQMRIERRVVPLPSSAG